MIRFPPNPVIPAPTPTARNPPPIAVSHSSTAFRSSASFILDETIRRVFLENLFASFWL
jgi:hypothetical protein